MTFTAKTAPSSLTVVADWTVAATRPAITTEPIQGSPMITAVRTASAIKRCEKSSKVRPHQFTAYQGPAIHCKKQD